MELGFSACSCDARMMCRDALSTTQTWRRSWTRDRMLLWNFRWSSLNAILGEKPSGLLVSSRLGTLLHPCFLSPFAIVCPGQDRFLRDPELFKSFTVLLLCRNYPLLMATWKVAAALAAGCTAVLKPSEIASVWVESHGFVKDWYQKKILCEVVCCIPHLLLRPIPANQQISMLWGLIGEARDWWTIKIFLREF